MKSTNEIIQSAVTAFDAQKVSDDLARKIYGPVQEIDAARKKVASLMVTIREKQEKHERWVNEENNRRLENIKTSERALVEHPELVDLLSKKIEAEKKELSALTQEIVDMIWLDESGSLTEEHKKAQETYHGLQSQYMPLLQAAQDAKEKFHQAYTAYFDAFTEAFLSANPKEELSTAKWVANHNYDSAKEKPNNFESVIRQSINNQLKKPNQEVVEQNSVAIESSEQKNNNFIDFKDMLFTSIRSALLDSKEYKDLKDHRDKKNENDVKRGLITEYLKAIEKATNEDGLYAAIKADKGDQTMRQNSGLGFYSIFHLGDQSKTDTLAIRLKRKLDTIIANPEKAMEEAILLSY